MEIINQIKSLVDNWKTMIVVCQKNIEKGNDVEGWQRLKNECTDGYYKVHNLLYKEMTCSGVTEETENGSYQDDEDARRECERHELELYNQE